MRLKGLSNRAYNVLFHTHTLSGIVISFALFVIFYAGAFSLFRDDVLRWENPEARTEIPIDLDYDKALLKVDSIYTLDRSQTTNIIFPSEASPFLKINGRYSKLDEGDTVAHTHRMSAYITNTYKVVDTETPVTTVGTTIYYLHYFRQIPVLGLYLSGLVALFFLFASVTGVLIHWRNLFTKFYAFVTEGKWKVIWTNAHTVLGVIGLPFQVMYALTGAFFGLLTLILLPSVFLLYDGDTTQVFNKFRVQNTVEIDPDAPAAKHFTVNELLKQVQADYPDYHVTRVTVKNYGKQDAMVVWRLDDHQNILSSGTITMRMSDGIMIESASVQPINKSYSQAVLNLMSKLHFAEFGGMMMKLIYFILSMITCFIIISGVMIWRKARDTPKYTLRQRLFHHKVTKLYLAICLSMFPAFALLFIANKLIPMDMANRVSWVNPIFFVGWLLLTVAGLFWNSYANLTRRYLLIGGILSTIVPLANGIVTGDWIWVVWSSYPRVAHVDVFWSCMGIISFYLVFKVLKYTDQSDKPSLEVDTRRRPKKDKVSVQQVAELV